MRRRGPAEPGTAKRFMSKELLSAIFLAGMVLALYAPLFQHTFHDLWDDKDYVTKNERTQRGVTADNVKWAFSTVHFGFYYPLTWLSHMLDVQLYGLDPRGHYFTNIAIHVMNTLLLFLLLNAATKRFYASLAFAALFALHPMNVQSVAWIAERKNLLSAFFLILAFWSYYKRRQGGGFRYTVFVHLFFLLGLMSKSSIVMFPVLLLLFDIWQIDRALAPERRSAPGLLWKVMKDKLFLLVLSAVFGSLTVLAQKKVDAISSLHFIPFGQRVGESLLGYGFYLLKMFIPCDLCALYPHHHGDYPLFLPILIFVILCAVTFFFWRLRPAEPVFLAGWLFFLVSLLPVIGLIQVGMQGYADRYVYFPYWGLFAVIAFGVPWKKAADAGHAMKRLLAVAAVATAAALFCLARVELAAWKNDESLFKKVIQVSPGSYLAYYNLGNYYDSVKNLPEKAEPFFEKALELHPGDPDILNNMGGCCLRMNDPEKALKYLDLALEADPDSCFSHFNRALALNDLRRPAEAFADLKKTAGCSAEALRGKTRDLGNVFAAVGRNLIIAKEFKSAEEALVEAARSDPENREIWFSLGYSLESQRRTDEAEAAYKRAVQINPGYDAPIFNIAVIEAKKGDIESARQRLQALKAMNSPLAGPLERGLTVPRKK